MIKVLISIKKNIVKLFLFSILIFPIIFLLNTGFLLDEYWKLVQAVILSLVLVIVLIWPNLRKGIFLLSLILIIIMILLYVLSLIEWADMVGSTGVGLITINLLSYLPQLVKLGYIKKL